METSDLKHVAIIMDGNGRWAKKRRLPVKIGHTQGARRIHEIIQTAKAERIKVVTLYAFSTENWKRSKEEINHLFNLVSLFYNREIDGLIKAGVKVRIIGKKEELPEKVLSTFDKMESQTKDGNEIELVIAFNYGSQIEIVDAVNHHISNNPGEKITTEQLEENLYTSGLPPVDLLIRTSGEKRISNFLLWQCAYAEFVFIDKLWPDFKKKVFLKCINEYKERSRRFGGR